MKEDSSNFIMMGERVKRLRDNAEPKPVDFGEFEEFLMPSDEEDEK
jgi:hypothetical protein